MPSSSQRGSTSGSGSRVHSEYSFWIAATGWTAWARRMVVRRRFRKTEVAHLAGRDQVLYRAGDILDGDVRIDAVLIEKIDVVRAEASQHRVRYALDVLRLAVEPASFARRRINVKAELGGDHDLVADGRQRFPEQGFVGPGTVDLGRIEQGDAEVVGAANDADALGLFRRLAVGRSEAQCPKAEFGHLQGAQLSSAHVATPIEPERPNAVSALAVGDVCEDGLAACS